MLLNAKINGIPCELEIPDDQLATISPEDLNATQAAKFCRMSRPTFAKLGIPKNQNGRYSVATLRERMKR